MGNAQGQPARSARCIALVGPYLSGKTTLLEAILARTGAITRQGSMADEQHGRRCLGGGAPSRHERRAQRGDRRFPRRQFHLPRLPGSIEFQADAANALTACDAAVVVCEPDEKKVPALQLILKQLEDRGIPHFLFINKIDKAEARVRDIVPMLQPASDQAAGAAPDPDLGERHRHRLHRSRAGARLRLSRACAERGDGHSRSARRA